MEITQKWFERIQLGILVLMVSSFYMFNISSFSSLSVVLFAALLFIVHIIQNKGIIQAPLTAFQGLVLAFISFCIISAVWADNRAAAISQGITILQILVCMTIVFWCNAGKDSAEDLLKAIMWSGPVIAVYSIYFYGPSMFVAMVSGSLRIGNDFANSNAIGMWAAISTTLFIYFIMHEGFKLQYCTVVMPILLIAMSQSRTAFAEVVIGVFLVLFFLYRDQKNVVQGFVKILFALFVVSIFLVILSQFEMFSGLRERIQSLFDYLAGKQVHEGSVIQRSLYIRAGLEQFKKTPFVGIGIGNTNQIARAATGHNTYLHNNFVELLASGGIIGFGLYYGITVYLLVKLLPYAMKKHFVSDACLIILLVHTIADYGTVSYYKKDTYFIFLSCFLQVYLNNYKCAKL